MIHELICPVTGISEVAERTFRLACDAGAIAAHVRAGQFVNVRVEEGLEPFLRRPFSVSSVHRSSVEILFNVVGKGTALLAAKKVGDTIDLLGPLGTPFSLHAEDFSTALLMAGGLGVAPMPIATSELRSRRKQVVTFLGGRSKAFLVEEGLSGLLVATDDGSRGFHGTVVALAEKYLAENAVDRPKIFACGPTPMLRAVAAWSLKAGIPCEVSLEGPMGCGIGICQGCPVELVGQERKYALMCKEGPVFDARKIIL